MLRKYKKPPLTTGPSEPLFFFLNIASPRRPGDHSDDHDFLKTSHPATIASTENGNLPILNLLGKPRNIFHNRNLHRLIALHPAKWRLRSTRRGHGLEIMTCPHLPPRARSIQLCTANVATIHRTVRKLYDVTMKTICFLHRHNLVLKISTFESSQGCLELSGKSSFSGADLRLLPSHDRGCNRCTPTVAPHRGTDPHRRSCEDPDDPTQCR